MSPPPLNKKSNLNLCIDVKYERLENMTSPLREFRRIFQNEQYTNQEKIDLLNKLIHNPKSLNEQLTYYSTRAFLYHETRNWKGALNDIEEVEKYRSLNGSLSIIKQKVYVQHHIQLVRESITNTISTDLIDNISDHLNLLDSINEDNIDDMLNNLKPNGRKLTKRKRKE